MDYWIIWDPVGLSERLLGFGVGLYGIEGYAVLRVPVWYGYLLFAIIIIGYDGMYGSIGAYWD